MTNESVLLIALVFLTTATVRGGPILLPTGPILVLTPDQTMNLSAAACQALKGTLTYSVKPGLFTDGTVTSCVANFYLNSLRYEFIAEFKHNQVTTADHVCTLKVEFLPSKLVVNKLYAGSKNCMNFGFEDQVPIPK